MAVPTVTATAVTTAGSTSSANPSVLLPATVNPGDILVALLRKDNEAVMTWPGGWNKIVGDASDAADDQTSLAWTTAVGNEDGTSITVTTGVAGKYAALSYAIGGADNIAVSSLAIGSSTVPNPPSSTPVGSTRDFLYLWMGGWQGEQTSPPAAAPTGTIFPSNALVNFTNVIGSSSGTAAGTATNCRVASARLNGASTTGVDANSMTISVSDAWTAFCVALWLEPVADPNLLQQNFARGRDW